jgi:chromosome segregation ATPase
MYHKTFCLSLVGKSINVISQSYAQACYSTSLDSSYPTIAAERRVELAIAEKERVRRRLQEVEQKGKGKRPVDKQASRWLMKSPPPGSTTPLSDLVRAWIPTNPAALANVSARTTNDQQGTYGLEQRLKARVKDLEKDLAVKKATMAEQMNSEQSELVREAVDRANAWWQEYQGESGRHKKTKEDYQQAYAYFEQCEQERDQLKTTVDQLQMSIEETKGGAQNSTIAFRQQIQQLNQTIAAYRNEIHSLQMDKGKHDSSHQKLRARYKDVVLENEGAMARINDLDNDVTRLRGERDGYRHKFHKIQREQKDLEARIAGPLHAEIRRLHDENQRQFREEMEPVQDQMKRLREEMLEVMNDREQRYNEREGILRADLQTARQDYDRERRQRRRLAEELEAWKRSQGRSRKKRTLCDILF